VEQGTTTLAEVGDNYRYGRTRVHELLLEHIKRDSTMPHEQAVGEGKQRKIISLNQKAPNDSGPMVNDVQMSTVRVILQDVPSTPGYRQQQFAMLAEMTKGLPPEVQAFIIPFIIEASDQPERKKMAATLRKAMNIPEIGDDDQAPQIPPEVQQQIQQGQMMLQEQAAQIQDLSQQLAKALNSLATEDAKHQHKMDEMAREEELARIKHNTTMVQSGVAPADEVKPLLDQFEQDVDGKLAQMMQVVQQIAAKLGAPKVTHVQDHGNGQFSVIQAPQGAAAAPAPVTPLEPASLPTGRMPEPSPAPGL
ncbi:MAG: hypothetical protein ABIR94_21815, partial [Rubrivivax sp.]